MFWLRNKKIIFGFALLTKVLRAYRKFRMSRYPIGLCITFASALEMSMPGSRKFCQRGSNFNIFFFVDGGREDPSTTISGPSSARQQNGVSPACQ